MKAILVYIYWLLWLNVVWSAKFDNLYIVSSVNSDEHDHDGQVSEYNQYEQTYSYRRRDEPSRQLGETTVTTNPLLKQATVASVAVFFVLLSWRTFSAHELASEFQSTILRMPTTMLTKLLLVSNLVGFLLAVARPFTSKNYLKMTLGMNIVKEYIELAFNIFMMVFATQSSSIAKEVYFGRFVGNTWFLLLCITFAKSRWVVSLQNDPNAAKNPANSEPHDRYKANF